MAASNNSLSIALTFFDDRLSKLSLAVMSDLSLELELTREVDQALVAEVDGRGSMDSCCYDM